MADDQASSRTTPYGELATVVLDRYQELPRLETLAAETRGAVELFQRLGFEPASQDFVRDGRARSIIDAFREWRPDAQRLVVVWAGHGKAVEDRMFYLCTVDTPRSREPDEHTAVRAASLGELLASLGVPRTVLLMDACNAGGGADQVVQAFRDKVSRTGWMGPKPALAVITSASRFQSARENVFMRAVTEVLRDGPPDDPSYLPWTERDRYISPDELHDAVRVKLGSVLGNDQDPDVDTTGSIGRFIPNPRFRPNVPDRTADLGPLRRPLVPADVSEHFMLKFRGIDNGSDTGWYFTGRTSSLRRVVRWLRDGTGMLVVTGRPGSGKSALLGRLAVLSVVEYRSEIERQGGLDGVDEATVPSVGAIDAGVHAKNKTLLGCVAEIGSALGLDPPSEGWQSPSDLLSRIAERVERVTVLVDALDEAQSSEVNRIAVDLLRPLAHLPGVRVLVGTRPGMAWQHAPDGPRPQESLLAALGVEEPDVVRVDLDVDSAADIAEYTTNRLVRIPGSAYAGREEVARRVGGLVAEHSEGAFLFARLLARVLAWRAAPADVDSSEFADLLSGGISEAFAAELVRFGPDERRARDILGTLAWAEGAGLPRRDVWLTVTNALSDAMYVESDLAWILEHGGEHVVVSGEDEQSVFRLYHQSYADYFRRGADGQGVQQRITAALLGLIETEGHRYWEAANPYLKRHLATHAAAGSVLAPLCEDFEFLVHAEPSGLQNALGSVDHHALPLVRAYWRGLGQLREAAPAERREVLARVALTEEPDAVPLLDSSTLLRWRPLWSRVRRSAFHRPLSGHGSPVLSLDIGSVDGRAVLATGGGDRTVRLWDGSTGRSNSILVGHRAPVLAVAVGSVDGRTVAVSGDTRGTVKLWDPVTRRHLADLASRDGAILSLNLFADTRGRPTIVCGDDAGALTVWRWPGPRIVAELHDHHSSVRAICVSGRSTGAPQVITGGDDGHVRFWDPTDWDATDDLDTVGYVTALAVTQLPGRLLLAVGGAFGTLNTWDVARGERLVSFAAHTSAVSAVQFGTAAGERVLASAGDDGGIRLWDPRTGVARRILRFSPTRRRGLVQQLTAPFLELDPAQADVGPADETMSYASVAGDHESVLAMRFAQWDGLDVLASTGIDGVLRIWELTAEGVAEDFLAMTAVGCGRIGGRDVVVVGSGAGSIDVHDARSGERIRHLGSHRGQVSTLTLGSIGGRPCVVSGGEDGRLQVWDAEGGAPRGDLAYTNPPGEPLYGSAFVDVRGKEQLVHTGTDRQAVVLDPRTGRRRTLVTGARPFVYLSESYPRSAGLLACATLAETTVVDGRGDKVMDVEDETYTCAPALALLDADILLATSTRIGGISIRARAAQFVRGDERAPTERTATSLADTPTAMRFGSVQGVGVLAVGCQDGSVTLLDTSGGHLLDLPPHHGAIRAMHFGAVGSTPLLVSVGDDGVHTLALPVAPEGTNPAPDAPDAPDALDAPDATAAMAANDEGNAGDDRREPARRWFHRRAT